ncbi:TauD/TfdA family dioxygenase [Chitinophaga sancti]|uniref:TauD/TfdA family dioxygenase n=1 Tax=Chitinophaga sancti TaxID=1004 RepID=A0A1K1SJR7_9BACT|nr:TauD/TfdA family dioxygenase [Chitinophaga sancti]WQD64511.1 TauD/TfdA family dioxygenase [Chitinophaga sancti]WQG89865.1 TauD/TfdA family dioxygenase [Chitinophaga sancti]SFW84585.1 Taurine catabolism dioxygenase TauD, TfdA family [Chitinophaga sancti]
MHLQEKTINEQALPMVLRFDEQTTVDDFIAWARTEESPVYQRVLDSGALWIKGLNIDSADKFQYLMQELYPSTKSFLDGNSSRGKYTSTVYNASEYDAGSIIQLHTEFSYSGEWPAVICFCCVVRPDEGGETTVGDCKQVLEKLNVSLVNDFRTKGITYIRNLHKGQGLGPSWQEAFESEDKNFVNEYCAKHNITVEWRKDGTGRFIQTRPAIRLHPQTNEELWFNQVDQFYPQIYGAEVYEALLAMNNGIKENLPMYATFGDGTEIPLEYIQEIIQVLDEVTIPVSWEKGDLLIVDNMASLHGRLPYRGNRKILASMA